MAHPFVVAANRGYLKDLRNAGFQTFHSLIDESYDQIDCPRARIERIIDAVHGISLSGSANFWEASRDICKYNQQHLVEYNREQRAELPRQLLSYIDEYS
jgi:fumarylacetoacetate (FAA) hydrolase family protein